MTAATRESLRKTRREAEGYLELGMPDHALRSLRRRSDLIYHDARGCYLVGETLRELQMYSQAVRPLQRALELIPDDVHAWMALGWCYKRIGRIEMAIESLEHALAVEPGLGVLHYNLACYCSLARRRRQALKHLADALDIDGNFRDFLAYETDFAPLRADPGFRDFLGEAP